MAAASAIAATNGSSAGSSAAPPAASALLRGEHTLDGVSAASGLEVSARDPSIAYVPGDDSVFLYEISLAAGPGFGAVRRRVRMAASRDVDVATGAVRSEEGVPKKVKHDFEAIAALPESFAPLVAARNGGSGGSGSGNSCDAGSGGIEILAVFGSGSKAGLRDAIALVDAATGAARSLDGGALLGALRGDARVVGSAKLNLEAAAVIGGGGSGDGGGGEGSGEGFLALFQRGNVPGGANSVVLIRLPDFRAYLEAAAAASKAASEAAAAAEAAAVRPPPYRVVRLALPPIQAAPDGGDAGGGGLVSYGAGVSAAATLRLKLPPGPAVAGGAQAAAGGETGQEQQQQEGEELLLVAASYEATLNEVDDGAVLGSRLALLPARRLLDVALAGGGGSAAGHEPPVVDLAPLSALIATGGTAGGGGGGVKPLVAKVEGVGARGARVERGGGGGGGGGGAAWEVVVDALAVTDPDGGPGALLEVELRVAGAALLPRR